MKHLFVLFFFALQAHATFAPTTAFTVPSRSGQKYFRLVDGATAVLDVGIEGPSRLFRLNDPHNFLLLTGFNEDNMSFYEHPSTHEIFFLGQQQDDSTYFVRRYIKGYSLANNTVTPTVSQMIFKGNNYSAPPVVTTESADGTFMYYFNRIANDNMLSTLNFVTHARTSLFAIPAFNGENITGLQEVTLLGVTSIAVMTANGDGLGSIYLFNPQTGAPVWHIAGNNLGLSSTGRTDLRPVEISPDGTRALLCDSSSCVLFNMNSQRPIDKLMMSGSTTSDAKFSPDNRFIFVSEGLGNATQFSIRRADDGSVILPPTPLDGGLLGKVIYVPDQQVYLLANGAMLLLVSHDGKLLQTFSQTDPMEVFTDLSLVDSAPGLIHFLSADGKGVVAKWELSF
jgi:WD40 repeat protein